MEEFLIFLIAYITVERYFNLKLNTNAFLKRGSVHILGRELFRHDFGTWRNEFVASVGKCFILTAEH